MPLFASVDPAVESLPTFAAFTALFDNYSPSPSQVEEQTEEELAEETRFLEEVAATEVMRTTYQFLVDRGEVTHRADPLLNNLSLGHYSLCITKHPLEIIDCELRKDKKKLFAKADL